LNHVKLFLQQGCPGGLHPFADRHNLTRARVGT
jgi:hypothetical protein